MYRRIDHVVAAAVSPQPQPDTVNLLGRLERDLQYVASHFMHICKYLHIFIEALKLRPATIRACRRLRCASCRRCRSTDHRCRRPPLLQHACGHACCVHANMHAACVARYRRRRRRRSSSNSPGRHRRISGWHRTYPTLVLICGLTCVLDIQTCAVTCVADAGTELRSYLECVQQPTLRLHPAQRKCWLSPAPGREPKHRVFCVQMWIRCSKCGIRCTA